MFVYFVTYTLKDKETRDGYYKAMKDMGMDTKSQAEEGCHGYTYYFPEAENQIFLIEKWETKELQAKHCQSPHFLEVTELKKKWGAETAIDILEVK